MQRVPAVRHGIFNYRDSKTFMMNRYFLLRRNEEYGPYTLEEIKMMRLLPSDLIWLDEAQRWMYPQEIGDVRIFADEGGSSSMNGALRRPADSAKCKPVIASEIVKQFPCRSESSVEKRQSVQSLPQFRENYREWKPSRKKVRRSLSSISDIMKVAIVFPGVVLGSIFLKKLVDGFDSGAEPASPINIERNITDLQAGEKSKDLVVAAAESSKNKELSLLKKQVRFTIEEHKNSTDPANSAVQLTVSNHSDRNFDKIMIAVDFVQQNGVLIKSEQLEVSSLPSLGTKTISIMGFTPGTSIRFHILRIDTKQQKARLRQA
jgi:hypothetical protein